jgi:hypothetical protein
LPCANVPEVLRAVPVSARLLALRLRVKVLMAVAAACVVALTVGTTAGVAQTRQAAEELARMSGDLQELVQRFRY